MKKPVIARVRSIERAGEIVSLCDEHGIKVVVGIEPDKAEDITDVERALAATTGSNSDSQAPGMPRIGRNAPCPCGSGRKYKKCCGSHELVARTTQPAEKLFGAKELQQDIDRLDRLSNGVLDAIEARRYEEAEDLCRQLGMHYPEMIDGPERLATLRSAQGRWEEAAEAYDHALEVIATEPQEYDRHLVSSLCIQRDDARRLAGLATDKPIPPTIAAYIAPAPIRLVQSIVRIFRGFRIR